MTSRLHRSILALWLVCLAMVLWPTKARAETWGQYLVLIDDSGSMDGSDPDRLVMMASLALAAALGDADQVMIVGLNELAKGEVRGPRFVSPRELLTERDGKEGTRELSGDRYESMARHQGRTPCGAALEQARSILDSVSGSGAPQTLLMLTDGGCSDTVVPADQWLAGLESHAQGQFRFALLGKQGAEKLDPTLLGYASATGFTGAAISFDARSLLRAFAEVLSFSRGLRYDNGGLAGHERTFAGAREVRVLAISEQGRAPIRLVWSERGEGTDHALERGPTYRHGEFGWSLRGAREDSHAQPFSVRSLDTGVDVLVIPSYGKLRIEAVVTPCSSVSPAGADGDPANPEASEAPPLPWTREKAVRSGQPACAWARLVGDSGQTIHPLRSFDFVMKLCEDEACTRASAMQPAEDGTFNAQLGVIAEGRHERWFRAEGGALAQPVTASRGFQSMAFGITQVARAEAPDQPIETVELGALPQALTSVITLELSGSFPAGASAALSCTVQDSVGQMNLLEGELSCLRCTPKQTSVALQDPVTVQVEVAATSFCPTLSEALGELPVALDLLVKPDPVPGSEGDQIAERRIPLRGKLRYAKLEPQRVEFVAGSSQKVSVSVPAAVNAEVALELEPLDEVPEELEVELATAELRMGSEPGSTTSIELALAASGCCETGEYRYSLTLRDKAGGPTITVPVTVSVTKPSFWVCPGKQIAMGLGAAALLGLLIWTIRGFTSPAKFADSAVLVRAESHEALAKVVDGDEDWRLVRSLEPTARGFYKPATIHLGGSKAALPSLRGQPDDARIEARPHGNATLVIEAEGIEQFRESSGWTPMPVGQHPIGSTIVLRRDDTYLQFRR